MFKLTPAVCLLAVLFTDTSFAATTETCEKYFKTIDSFMAEAQKNEAMKGQTDMLKSQYD